MKSRLRDRLSKLRQIGWSGIILGAIFGVVVSAILGPYMTFLGVHFLHSQNAPLYETPNVDVTIAQTTNLYHEGDTAPEFGNLTWESDYEIYHVNIRNNGRDLIRDLDFVLPLPGCAVYTQTDGTGVGGKVTARDALGIRLSTDSREGIDAYPCAKQLSAENLGPDEAIAVNIVVKEEFDRCDMLVGFNPHVEPRIMYSWMENGIRLTENKSLPTGQMSGEYEDVRRFNVSSATQGGGDWIHGSYYTTVMLGVNSTDMNQAITECGS